MIAVFRVDVVNFPRLSILSRHLESKVYIFIQQFMWINVENGLMDMDCYTQLNIRKSTKSLILNDVKEEILKHNPKMRGMKLSHDYLINYIAKYFLED